jgi:hypothetical protein
MKQKKRQHELWNRDSKPYWNSCESCENVACLRFRGTAPILRAIKQHLQIGDTFSKQSDRLERKWSNVRSWAISQALFVMIHRD